MDTYRLACSAQAIGWAFVTCSTQAISWIFAACSTQAIGRAFAYTGLSELVFHGAPLSFVSVPILEFPRVQNRVQNQADFPSILVNPDCPENESGIIALVV